MGSTITDTHTSIFILAGAGTTPKTFQSNPDESTVIGTSTFPVLIASFQVNDISSTTSSNSSTPFNSIGSDFFTVLTIKVDWVVSKISISSASSSASSLSSSSSSFSKFSSSSSDSTDFAFSSVILSSSALVSSLEILV